MRKQFAKDKILLLLGAGASCDAGIKNSFQMINEIQNSLKEEWKAFRELYDYIHSSHYHLERIKGHDSSDIVFNIENLVGLLDSIIKIASKDVDVYPFIGSWEKELHIVAGPKLKKAQEFKKVILEKMKNTWLSPEEFISKSKYYAKIKEIGFNYPLKIFSLNYDMCVEKNLEGVNLERGFNEQRIWDYRLYEPGEEQEKNFFLYKLHGSLDWKRDKENRLIFTDNISNVEPMKMEIIFGMQNKLQSYDPYLFYFYSFREACIEAELIVISGYGFLDKHINDNIATALKGDRNKKLLINILGGEHELEGFKQKVIEKTNAKPENIIIENIPAKDFFCTKMNLEHFSTLFPTDTSEPALR